MKGGFVTLDNIATPTCAQFIRGYWDDDEITEGLKDPVRFVRRTVNPYLRENGLPTVMIKGRPGAIRLILSTEEKK